MADSFLPLSGIYLFIYFLKTLYLCASPFLLCGHLLKRLLCAESVFLWIFMTDYRLAPQHLHADPCPSVSRTTLFKHLSARSALVVMQCCILTGWTAGAASHCSLESLHAVYSLYCFYCCVVFVNVHLLGALPVYLDLIVTSPSYMSCDSLLHRRN